jgi:hypothetical protein
MRIKACVHSVKSNAIFQIVLHAHKRATREFEDLRLAHTSNIHEYDYTNSGCVGSTSTLPCAATTRHSAMSSTSTSSCATTARLRPHVLYVDLAVRRNYSSPAARALRRPRRAPRLLVSGCTRSTSTLPCAATTRRPVAPAAAIYLDNAVRPGASTRRVARHAARRAARHRLLRVAQARRRLLHLRRASGCLGTSRGSSRGSSRPSSSTTPRRAGSSSTTPPRVRVPRHVARLVTRLVAPLVVDYSASPRLVVDYSTTRPGASARRAARHAACRAARRRLLRLAQARRRLLHRASGCLGTSRGSSCGSSPLVDDYSASRNLVVDYSVRRDFVLRPH